ncbi:GNAT family N-acetyltransferase [Ureibacillus acetophenoni]|uniref:Acetyltransferase (GNAT) family protein n=1 Tax=Ureibacillus acetophenoni TaxID=614649 RepID=A0A285UKJ7_9BACL|nr:GNAT family N-acetyltransferase [Ureibacillus acetophenoni]SOC42444.1 acetyltransferase (GNAT) family protein [Ureibacillus acetophenoni]
MTIIIRNATQEDVNQVAPLIYDAIGDIANRLTGESSEHKILEQLELLFCQNDNRHSYLNTYVAVNEIDSLKILGILVLYSGEDGIKMDTALQNWLKIKHGKTIKIDQEAHLDEFYVDTICVHEKCRGLGIGTKLLQFAEEIAMQKGFTKISLNVETKKDNARRLYESIGYVVTEPWTIIDEPFHHMVKKL